MRPGTGRSIFTKGVVPAQAGTHNPQILIAERHDYRVCLSHPTLNERPRRRDERSLTLGSSAFAGEDGALSYSAACCATVGSVPATVARRMSRGCD